MSCKKITKISWISFIQICYLPHLPYYSESLRLQGDQTSQSYRKSVLNIHWKEWCWSWNSNTLPLYVKSWLVGKDSDAGRDWGQEEKKTPENEMVGGHHRLDGHKFEQAPGVGDGQESLPCCSSWGHKELDMTQQHL